MSRKKGDGVEAMLRQADAALDDWFKQSRITSQQASQAFARFLDRTKRQGAGALRLQVDGLQAGLKKLSSGLEQLEGKPGKPKATRRPAARRKTVSARKTRKAA